jgi:putative salt-induced outer membrane protein YdiY
VINPLHRKEVTIKKLTLTITTWLLAITAAHFALNVNWQVLMNDRLPEADRKLNVAYIPVT